MTRINPDPPPDQQLPTPLDKSGSTSINLDIDVDVRSPNFKFEGWRSRAGHTARVRGQVQEILQDIPPPNWEKVFITLCRNAPQPLDDDNLRMAFKPHRDQVAAWLGIDDADERVRWNYAQKNIKVPNTRENSKTTYKVWARVYLTPEPHDLSSVDAEVRLRAPRKAPTELANPKKAHFVQKPKAVPEFAGGEPITYIELEPRPNGVSSRMRIRLMRNTRDTGIGKGVPYAHVSLFWEQNGQGWRSQGVAIRLEEMREVAYALSLLADRCGVPALPRGVILMGEREGGGSDTPSDDVNNIDVGKGAQHPREYSNPLEYPSSNPPENPHQKPLALEPNTDPLEPPPAEGAGQNRPGSEMTHYKRWRSGYRAATPEQPPREHRARPRQNAVDCNATAEDADVGQDE